VDFQDRPSCCLVAPDEDENELPPHLHPLLPGERKEKIKDEILTPS